MKRFSKVVRHPHKLTRWSAGTRKKANKDKKEVRVMFCEEQNISRDDRGDNVGSSIDVQSVFRAWNALKKARNDAATLKNLLEVLLGSCVTPCECIYEVAVMQRDIRTLLCDKRLVCKLLVKLSVHWEEVIDSLMLTTDEHQTLLKNKPLHHDDVSVDILRLFGWTSALDVEEISVQHLTELMPWLSQYDNLTARIICDDWERLPNGLAGKLLFAFSHPESLRSWMDALLTLQPTDGSFLMWVLLDHDVSTEVVTEDLAPLLCFVFHQYHILDDVQRLIQFVKYLLKGRSLKRLECLLDLEKLAKKVGSHGHTDKKGLDDIEAIEPFLEYFSDDQIIESWAGEFSSNEWRYAAGRMKYHDLDKEESEHFGTLILNQSSYLEGDEDAKKWYMDASAMAFKTVDKKFYSKLSDLLFYRFNCGESLLKWQKMLKMVLILCGLKMSAKSNINSFLITVEDKLLEKLMIDNLLPSAWQNIDSYYRSENKGDILNEGIGRVLKHDRSFIHTVIRGMNASPAITLKAIAGIGSHPISQMKRVFEWLEHHPLNGQNKSEISQRCSILDHFSIQFPSIDLPKKLIGLNLANVDVSSLRKEVLEKEMVKLEAAEMRMLYTAISEHISELLSTRTGTNHLDAHSIAMVNTVKLNRRGGKRALKRHGSKGELARLLHPTNIHWLQKPKAFWRPAVWVKGVSEELQLVNIGKVTIQTEHRLSEILKMGTYVNSCLSIGGCNQHSAIANALDANKRVLYLRDSEGKFIARQLLAITKERKLACFMVYHSGHQHDRRMIEYCFSRTDKKFAAELGLTIQEEDDYEIEKVVCRDWYDDGIWIPPSNEEAS